MDSYAKRYPLIDDEFDTFVFYVDVLDTKLLELIKNKPKPKERGAK